MSGGTSAVPATGEAAPSGGGARKRDSLGTAGSAVQLIIRDLGEVHSRLLDHRPVIQGEARYFVKEFEEKRGLREVRVLQSLQNGTQETRDQVLPRCQEAMGRSLSPVLHTPQPEEGVALVLILDGRVLLRGGSGSSCRDPPAWASVGIELSETGPREWQGLRPRSCLVGGGGEGAPPPVSPPLAPSCPYLPPQAEYLPQVTLPAAGACMQSHVWGAPHDCLLSSQTLGSRSLASEQRRRAQWEEFVRQQRAGQAAVDEEHGRALGRLRAQYARMEEELAKASAF
ncbi:PREDICTED: biogenesis of lysosome-related organelles complex 1 subunit 5 [Condylura cristata]|uniref:biogenesis of lysosome-related organelles complex 1 subunit 5 n=1 Tax=Condylura cristata TaxID=143302 RepID=UPI0006428D9E|nr:PREDICTED: biogenesis of lysosome-related organelles complex 1 subunit 5 [Condylura cristata]